MNTSGSKRLLGRRIVITGGASGIGRATAALFVAEGAKVCIFDRNRGAMEAAVTDLGCSGFAVDITDPHCVKAACAQAAQAMEGIDGIVNAAGVTSAGSVADTSFDLWQTTIAINLTGPFLVVQGALPFLKAAEYATIVNISSGAGILPRADRSAYSASKGGLQALTRALAAELAPTIRANVICPGSVKTPMLKTSLTTDRSDEASRGDRYALKRVAEVEEVANSILFLTSSESSYITGVTLAVDGGRTFH